MFRFSKNSKITADVNVSVSRSVDRFMRILERDRDKIFTDSLVPANEVVLIYKDMEFVEQFCVCVGNDLIEIHAGDDLGMIYGLLYISEHYLNVRPFWFYMDQSIEHKEYVAIPEGSYVSEPYKVRFRGWFINDEVLMMKWKFNENNVSGWEMALEALLRCGGNIVIPGTDIMSRKNRKLATDMGLWITHHHAEPLGAEMFARVYPGVEADFLEHEDLFYCLWENAVLEQKDSHVVWNLCFRGQGDMPFWASDKSGRFNSPEARGKLIGDVIKKQRQLVEKHVKNPVFCTNLYGEIMELYEQGYLDLAPDIIKVRADNGYGKMVTRRQNNHNPRIVSMPDPTDKSPRGIYYHVSFYDLQAANHITMLPNSVDFVDKELAQVLKSGGEDFWIVNSSNIRPHVYYLDAIRKKWSGRTISDEGHSREFSKDYFAGNMAVAECYRNYPKAMISYGKHEDEHMGEQYYAENIRVLVNQFFVDKNHPSEHLKWIECEAEEEKAAMASSLAQQVQNVCSPCAKGLPGLQILLDQCEAVSESLTGSQKQLFDATIYLQAKIHKYCAQGTAMFAQGYEAYVHEDYRTAFMTLGDSAASFDRADESMKLAEYGVWEDFYKNDCLADIRYTAYMIRKLMGTMRELGDSAYHDKWQRQYCNPDEQGVVLLMFTERHKTDWEIYLAMNAYYKNKYGRT